MVEAIRDQWLIVAALVVVAALIGWLVATRRRTPRRGG
jgi:hypothetical protein